MRFLWAIVILLLAFIGWGVLAQNRDEVSLVYYNWRSPMLPVAIHVLCAFAAGFLLAVVLSVFSDISEKVRLRRALREAGRLAGEVARLAGEPPPPRAGRGDARPEGGDRGPASPR